MTKRYGEFDPTKFPRGLLDKDFNAYVLTAEKKIIDEYKLSYRQLKQLIMLKPSILLMEDQKKNSQSGMQVLKEFFVDEIGYDISQLKGMIVRNTAMIDRSLPQLKKLYEQFKKYDIDHHQAFLMIQNCPRLTSIDFEYNLNETNFLFNMYCDFDVEDTMKIVKKFPYVLAMDHRKLTLFCGQFKKYRLTKEQIINYTTKNTGLLGCDVSNFKGLFDSMLNYRITAKETKALCDKIPQLVIQNRQGMFTKKILQMQKEGGRSKAYMRNFIKRNPDIFMK
jgi:hypothetical protein